MPDAADEPFNASRRVAMASGAALLGSSILGGLAAKAQPGTTQTSAPTGNAMPSGYNILFNSDLPSEIVQGLNHAMPIARAPDDELNRATWDDYGLPASRHQPFDSPGRPVAQKLYHQILDLQVGRWPDEGSPLAGFA